MAQKLLSDWGGGAHHNQDQPRVLPSPVFSLVLGHLFSLLGLCNEKKKRKHLQTSDKKSKTFFTNNDNTIAIQIKPYGFIFIVIVLSLLVRKSEVFCLS